MPITKNKPNRWLRLTSPYMHGEDVEALQVGVNKRLAARGRKGINADGEYGGATRDAVRSALWFLGCPSDNLDAGATLKNQYALRDPEGHRPQEWFAIAGDREAWLAHQDKGWKGFLKIVSGYVGKTEQPKDSNRGPWLDPLHKAAGFNPADRAPYCAIGLIACFRKAGMDSVKNGWAYTPSWVSDIRNGAMGWKSVPVAHRLPSDVFFIKIPGVSQAVCDHVGTIDEGITHTLEFNTSSGKGGSQNNGGGVWRRDFNDRAPMVVCVGRPPWNK